jgi:hypothetical protein
MSRRTFEFLPRFAPLAAGAGLVLDSGPFRHGLPGVRPVIVRPQVARHGGGGGGHGGGHGHGGHHQATFGAGGPGYPGPAGTGGNTDWKTILFSLSFVALLITFLVLGIKREVMAVVVLATVIFGVPLMAIPVLLLLLLLAKLASHLPWGKRSSGDH